METLGPLSAEQAGEQLLSVYRQYLKGIITYVELQMEQLEISAHLHLVTPVGK